MNRDRLLKIIGIVIGYLLVAPVLAWACGYLPATSHQLEVSVFWRCWCWIFVGLIVAALGWQIARLVWEMAHRHRWHISLFGLVMMISGLVFDYGCLIFMGGWWDWFFSDSCFMWGQIIWYYFILLILQAPHGFVRTMYRRWFMRHWPKRYAECWVSYFMLVTALLLVLVVGRTELRVIQDVRYTYFKTPEEQFNYAKDIIDANRYGEDFEERGCTCNYLVGPFHSDSGILRTHAAFNARVAQRRGCQVPRLYRMNETERKVWWGTDWGKYRREGIDVPPDELKFLEDCSLEATSGKSINKRNWTGFVVTALKNEMLVYDIYMTRYR